MKKQLELYKVLKKEYDNDVIIYQQKEAQKHARNNLSENVISLL